MYKLIPFFSSSPYFDMFQVFTESLPLSLKSWATIGNPRVQPLPLSMGLSEEIRGKYEGIRRNMWKIWRTTKKYVGICEKYVEICCSGNWNNETRCESSYAPFSLYKDSETWKNSELPPPPPYRFWNLEERGASRHKYLSSYIKAPGIEKVRLGLEERVVIYIFLPI